MQSKIMIITCTFFPAKLRADVIIDQMPGPPQEGQLMCTLLSKHAFSRGI